MDFFDNGSFSNVHLEMSLQCQIVLSFTSRLGTCRALDIHF